MRKEYKTVKIPVELSEKLDRVGRDLGYRSRAKIVNDAIGRFLVTKRDELRGFNNFTSEIASQISSQKLRRASALARKL